MSQSINQSELQEGKSAHRSQLNDADDTADYDRTLLEEAEEILGNS